MAKTLNNQDLFQDFVERDNDLRKVTRYAMYSVMLYRSNLYTHSHRVAAIVRTINPIAAKLLGNKYDPKKANILGLVHDDAEIIFGDIMAANKSKMTPQQLEHIKQAEIQAIDIITKKYPINIAGYNYKQLLSEAENHSTLESQVMQFADKYDAMGEAMHEMHAGNPYFLKHIVNEYGKHPTPIEHYVNYFANFLQKFPKMKPLFSSHIPMFAPLPKPIIYKNIVKSGQIHTINNIAQQTGDHHYDTWKKIVLSSQNYETVKALHTQKEYL